MKRQCEICGQNGDSFLRVNPQSEEIERIENPLSWYKPASALICQDCRHECAEEGLVGCVNDARSDRFAEAIYQSQYAYACGYRD